MNISFECADKVNGVLTMTIEKADYEEAVTKTLKKYRKQANVPGFRPGTAPMGLIQRQYGTSVKVDEINKLLGEHINSYLKENHINMLGEPLSSESQKELDFEKGESFEFVFDIAVAPEFKIELTGKDKVDYYNIKVDDALVDRQVEMFAQRAGQYVQVDSYEDKDMLKGDLRELADGQTKEDGITVDNAVLSPDYIKDEVQKKLFAGCKPGDIITFNPRKAYDSDIEIASMLKMKKEEVAEIDSDFTFQVLEITRFKAADVDQKLFDQVYGEGTCKDEKEFRQKIADGIRPQLQADSDYKFLIDVRKYAEDKVGQLTFPDALLKKIMLRNNKERGEEFVEKNYEQSIKELTWHLIKEQLVEANGIKIDDKDVKQAAKEATRAQFAQYGMTQIPDDLVEKYAEEQLKKEESVQSLVDRSIDVKLTQVLKGVVKLNEKEVTLDEFNKLFQ